jgi:hypothetical protein
LCYRLTRFPAFKFFGFKELFVFVKPAKIFSYLVPAGKGQEDPEQISGTPVPLAGNLFKMLSGVFEKSETECKVPIRFITGGVQRNPVRDEIRDLLKGPTFAKGRKLAERLRDVSTGKSRLGLLFLLAGQDGPTHKIVISRFPADEGVLAERKKGSLQVAFVEQIFMKNAKTYKAALYKGKSIDAGFWDGHVVDRQIAASQDQVAHYWIRQFLQSDFMTTSKAGSKRLATALKEASKAADTLQTKQEILAAIALTRNFYGKTVSIRDLSARLNLSVSARKAIEGQFDNEALLTDTFVLDSGEFQHHAAFAMVELDQGAMLTAPADRFDECFKREQVDGTGNEPRFRFTTEGQIVDERLKSRK